MKDELNASINSVNKLLSKISLKNANLTVYIKDNKVELKHSKEGSPYGVIAIDDNTDNTIKLLVEQGAIKKNAKHSDMLMLRQYLAYIYLLNKYEKI